MPRVRATLFFRQQGYGWSETWFKDGQSNDPASYFNDVDQLAQKRIKLSGVETSIGFLRISIEGVFRDAVLTSYTGAGLTGVATQPSDAPTTSLLVRHRNQASTKWRNMFLRGVWDSVVTTGGLYAPTATYVANFNAWIQQLVDGAWGWQGNDVTTQANVATVLQDLPSGAVDVTVVGNLAAGPFPQDATVRISGVGGATQVNGTQIVRFSTATSFRTRRRIAIFPYTLGGRVRLSTIQLIPVFTGNVQRVVERKVGRPSYLSRGRRAGRIAG